MLRDKNLIPLSHQHQHALALCVRIDRASPIPDADLDAWQTEIEQLFRSEIEIHFVAEEQVIFPVARGFESLTSLVEDLLSDHAALRKGFGLAADRKMSAVDLSAFGQRLAAHIRKEERQLFERLQDRMSQKELAHIGKQLESALEKAAKVCTLPNATTKLRAGE
jgi:iron-sulfur cluster repair protein YtfE (RIC family)